MHYFIIGGTGFIGSHLTRELASHGVQTTVIGRKKFPQRNLPSNVEYIYGDYGDKQFLKNNLLSGCNIVHLAYSSVPKTSFDNPVQDILDNLPATVNLFDIASKISINKLVLVSSGGTVYGPAQELPTPESHPTVPVSPYGITKLASEKYAMMYKAIRSLPVVCVRPANAYGPEQNAFSGQGFIATAIASILNRKTITIFGKKGTIRDYIHVKDVASGIIAAIERGIPGKSYNIGSGVGRDNRQVLDQILPFAKRAGFEPKVETTASRKFDVPANILDSTKLKHDTGWDTTICFEEGIELTWNWYYHKHIQQATNR